MISVRERTRSFAPKVDGAGLVTVLAIVLAVWVSWQIVRGVVVQNAPPGLALRLAPDSPTVLSRAAEAEFAAGQSENAAVLARLALARSPFNVRALRISGLTEAKHGSLADADQILTLAGNWSLRDDPAHAWLIERRLRQGAFTSAFAHADAIARRRRDLDESIFALFTTAANENSTGLRAIASELRDSPPWRKLYLESAVKSPDGQVAVVNLAILLQGTPGRFSPSELEALYMALLTDKRTDAVRVLADRLQRPVPGTLRNGGFGDPATTKPFDWALKVSDGVIAEVVPDDADPARMALRVDYNGSSSQRAADQALLLSPGDYTLTGSVKSEDAGHEGGLGWVVTCLESGRAISTPARQQPAQAFAWTTFSLGISVPESGCSVQWLTLFATPGDRAGPLVRWFDDMEIHR